MVIRSNHRKTIALIALPYPILFIAGIPLNEVTEPLFNILHRRLDLSG
jgi:hypothetical protein